MAKKSYEIAIDAVSSLVTSAGSGEIIKLFRKEYNGLVNNASYMSPLTKAEKNAARKRADFVSGDFFDNFINSLSQYFGGTAGKTSNKLLKDWIEGEPEEQEPFFQYYDEWLQNNSDLTQGY